MYSQHNSGQPNLCDASGMFSEEVWVGRRVGFVFLVGSKKEGRWGSGTRAADTVGGRLPSRYRIVAAETKAWVSVGQGNTW